ncbi:MAG: hypothetical protein WAL32_17095 [Terriglobales bacterium]
MLWRTVWFARVTLTLVLFLVGITRKVYREFPLFFVLSGWLALAGVGVLAVDYIPSFNGYQYFAAVAISNGLEAILAFALIYQMFAQRAGQYPVVKKLGNTAFRAATLFLLVAAVALAWLSPGLGASHWTSIYAVTDRTVRLLQCGQLLFLFLFFRYFQLSWRSRAFGIALGLGVLSSSSLAIDAIRSQIASGHTLTLSWYLLSIASDSTCMIAVSVWLAYLVAPERAWPEDAPKPPDPGLPEHDLETWNRELQRLL